MQTRKIDLVLNKLLKAQYQGTTPNADELYLVTDDAGITSADVVNALGYTPGTVKSVNNTSPDGSGNVSITVGDTLPSQSGQSGKYLTTDGTSTSWGTPTASAAWGSITGTLSDQTDLQDALDAKQDEATAVNYDNITNCLTEIPQDIKLELSSGTLTLKAGSKVYVPNGASVFDVVTIASDITMTSTQGTSLMVCVNQSGTSFGFRSPSSYSSGTSDPQTTGTTYYDTSANTITSYTGGGPVRQSLPICIISGDSTQITSIDQVFNGFGYIGSTIFALPNVKGLIPNERNADGTLKNTETTANGVLTYTSPDTPTGNYHIQFRGDYISRAYANPNNWRYDEERNIILCNNTSKQEVLFAGNLVLSSGRVESLTIKTAFHALDYSDSPTIAGWALPNNQSIELTVGASGASYTAPANGWFCIKSSVINKTSNYESGYETSYGGRGQINTYGYSNYGGAVVPVLKGQTVTFTYQTNTTNRSIKFVYAEGENV